MDCSPSKFTDAIDNFLKVVLCGVSIDSTLSPNEMKMDKSLDIKLTKCIFYSNQTLISKQNLFRQLSTTVDSV